MRVLVADAHATVRSALRLLLEQMLGAGAVIDEVAEVPALVACVQSCAPHLLLVDWELCRPDPAGLLARLREASPDLRVIVLSSRPEARAPALASGAAGFVFKGDPPEQLLQALHAAGLPRPS